MHQTWYFSELVLRGAHNRTTNCHLKAMHSLKCFKILAPDKTTHAAEQIRSVDCAPRTQSRAQYPSKPCKFPNDQSMAHDQCWRSGVRWSNLCHMDVNGNKAEITAVKRMQPPTHDFAASVRSVPGGHCISAFWGTPADAEMRPNVSVIRVRGCSSLPGWWCGLEGAT